MMNTSAILPAATGSNPGDGSAGPSRNGAADDSDAGFRDLLSKLKGQHKSGADAPPGTQNPRNEDATTEKIADPLNNPEPRFSSPATNLAALVQGLSAANAAPAHDIAGVLSRIANGTATDADEALVRAAVPQDGFGDLPEQAIAAALAGVGSKGKQHPAGASDDPVGAILTVLRRETHFAPVQAMAGAGAGNEWAADLLARVRQNTQLATPSQAAPISGASGQTSSTAQIVTVGTAVTAAAGGQLGTSSGQSHSPMDDLRSMAEALMASGESSGVSNEDGLSTSGAGTTVTQQIAGRVTADAAALLSNARPEAPTTVKHGSPVKVLYLELQPADLGVVTIRMSVKDNALRLQLEVGRHGTAQLIQRDREALTAMLRSAGYLIDGMEIRLADPASAAMQPGSAQANSHGQSEDPGSFQSDAGSSKERGQHGRPNGSFANKSNSEDEQAGRTSGPGGLYV